jgi:hypothetical protein
MGGELEIVAKFPEGSVKVEKFGGQAYEDEERGQVGF